MKKRLFAVLLTICMIMSVLPTMAMAESAVWDGTTADTSWYSDPSAATFTISSGAELAGLAKLVNEGNTFSGKTITLGDNIDLGNKDWTPIGGATQGKDFLGTFDGNGNTISNLYVHSTDKNGNGFGLFGKSSKGTVQNLTIHNAHVMGNSAVAAIAGESNGTFTNVHVTGRIEIGTTTDQAGQANYNSSYVGGIVGHSYPNPKVTDCSVEGDGIATSYIRGGRQVGGIVGFTGEAGGVTADRCTVKNITIEGVKCVGGIDGWLYGNGITVQNCTVDSVVVHLKATSETDSLGLISGGSYAAGKVCYTSNTVVNSVLKLNGAEQPGSEPMGYYAGYGAKIYIDKSSKSYDYFNGTLSAAIEKAEDGQTVGTLVDVKENITIPAGKNLTIDLNGHSIDGTISNEGQLTIKNGTVWKPVTGNAPTYENASVKTPAASLGSGSSAVNYETLQEAVDAAAASGKHGYVHILKDTSEDLTIPASAEWTSFYDEGHTLSGNVTNNGNMNFYSSKGTHNWTITNNGKLTLSKKQNTGLTVVNNGTLSITGGATYDLSRITNQEGGTVSITGGTFSTKPDDAWIATGYIAKQNDDGYKVGLMTDEEAVVAGCVARYASSTSKYRKYYKTLSDGFKEENALHLLKDVTEDVTSNDYAELFCDGNTFSGSVNCSGYSLYVYTGDQGVATLNSVQCKKLYVGGTQHKAVNVVVSGGTVTDAIEVSKDSALTIDGGVFTGSTITVDSTTGSLTITGGDFAADPTPYIDAEKYAVTLSDVSGCNYKVVEKTDDVEVQEVVVLPAVGKTDGKVDESLNLPPEQETAVQEAAGSVSCDLTDVARQENQNVHNDIYDENTTTSVDDYVTEDVVTELEEEKENINLFTQVYLEVVAEGYEQTEGQSVLTLNITPMAQVVATTADKAKDIKLEKDIKNEGEKPNAVVVEEPKAVEIHKEVSVTITLPDGFPVDNLVIKHTKSDETVEYCSFTVNGQEVTFVTHGFSPVAFLANAAAKITDADGHTTSYPTLQDAVDAVQDGQEIVLVRDNEEEVTVSRTVSFTLNKNEKNFTGSIKAGADTNLEEKDGTYTATYNPPVVVPADKDEDEKDELDFVDVSPRDYFYDAVAWAVEEGVTTGTTWNTFGPYNGCTRAQAVTFLWRALGEPEPDADTCDFTDVSTDAYYYDAVLWAVENGITKGTTDTTFSPNTTCTRAQIVAFLYRAAKSPAVRGSNDFTDVADDAYYADAVTWAVENFITTGTTDTTFGPDETCTRAQIVTFLYRYCGD